MSDNPLLLTRARAQSLVRAADAMLFALGSEPLTLRFPLPVTPPDPPTTEDIVIAPAHLRQVAVNPDGRRRFEALLSATAVDELTLSRSAESANDLFDSAVAVFREDRLLRIARVAFDSVADVPYLYRLTLIE